MAVCDLFPIQQTEQHRKMLCGHFVDVAPRPWGSPGLAPAPGPGQGSKPWAAGPVPQALGLGPGAQGLRALGFGPLLSMEYLRRGW